MRAQNNNTKFTRLSYYVNAMFSSTSSSSSSSSSSLFSSFFIGFYNLIYCHSWRDMSQVWSFNENENKKTVSNVHRHYPHRLFGQTSVWPSVLAARCSLYFIEICTGIEWIGNKAAEINRMNKMCNNSLPSWRESKISNWILMGACQCCWPSFINCGMQCTVIHTIRWNVLFVQSSVFTV